MIDKILESPTLAATETLHFKRYHHVKVMYLEYHF